MESVLPAGMLAERPWIIDVTILTNASESRPSLKSRRRRGVAGLNEVARKALFRMPKSKPTIGPMRTQPGERTSIMPTQVLPAMPAAGKKSAAAQRKQEPKQKPTRSEAVRTAKARISRRNSLQKQREALRG
jgi:hypothetical protein